jgi:hypothetical protein
MTSQLHATGEQGHLLPFSGPIMGKVKALVECSNQGQQESDLREVSQDNQLFMLHRF